jgi:ketosteroid isomerase-like protein
MVRLLTRLLPLLPLLLLVNAARVSAQEPIASPVAKAEAEVREAIRQYDDALRRADVSAAERFWATEYTFVNPRGERVTRDDRIANLRTGKTSLDTIIHAPQDEKIRIYGEMAIYTALLTLTGRYGGQAHQGQARAMAVWVHRDGRWQQVATQLTPISGRLREN